MPRKYRCKYTRVHRCKELATVRLRMQYTVISGLHLTRVCERHALALESMCSVTSVSCERI